MKGDDGRFGHKIRVVGGPPPGGPGGRPQMKLKKKRGAKKATRRRSLSIRLQKSKMQERRETTPLTKQGSEGERKGHAAARQEKTAKQKRDRISQFHQGHHRLDPGTGRAL